MNWNNSKLTFDGRDSARITWFPLQQKTDLAIKKTGMKQHIQTYNQNPFGILTSSNSKWVFTNVRKADQMMQCLTLHGKSVSAEN